MVSAVVFEFGVMRCQPLRRALCALEKIMKKWLLIMLASFSSVVSAENESLDCKNAMNTFEINQCASMALDSAQAELTKYLEASFEHNANDPDLVSAIQVAQKDWQSYMSSHCNSVYTQWRDGSIRGVLAISCKTQLTRQRTHEIWKNFLTYMDSTAPVLSEPSME